MEINSPSGSLIAFFIVLLIVYVGIIALLIISLWKIFLKANQPGWAAIVPFYNFYIMNIIARKPGWWFGMMFIPVVNIIFMIMIINGIVKNFGKSNGFTVGIVFLPFIFYPILAFGNATYLFSPLQISKDLLDN